MVTNCRTMNQFLCGCPIWFGVSLIILVNALHNVFYIVCVTLNIIFKIPTFGANDPPASQVFNAAWCLVGIPFILAAIAGMITKQESNMRLYLVYLSTTFLLDLVLVVQFLSGDLCGNMPRSLQKHGGAFACGFIRITSVGFTVMMMIIMAYAVYTVWSFCEDLKAGGGGRGLDQLMVYQEEKKLASAYQTFAGSVGSVGQAVSTGISTAAGANTTGNKMQHMGGGQRLKFPATSYSGNYHETNYPAPPKPFRS